MQLYQADQKQAAHLPVLQYTTVGQFPIFNKWNTSTTLEGKEVLWVYEIAVE
jgi:hypothetical protein